MKTGMNAPKDGTINIKDNHFLSEHAPFTLKIMKSIIVANVKPSAMKSVANTLLHTSPPIKKGCKNNSWLSI